MIIIVFKQIILPVQYQHIIKLRYVIWPKVAIILKALHLLLTYKALIDVARGSHHAVISVLIRQSSFDFKSAELSRAAICIKLNETRDAKLVNFFIKNRAANSSSSFMWQDWPRSTHGRLAVTPLRTAPHPDRDASEKITRSGSSVESSRPLVLSTLVVQHTKSEI